MGRGAPTLLRARTQHQRHLHRRHHPQCDIRAPHDQRQGGLGLHPRRHRRLCQRIPGFRKVPQRILRFTREENPILHRE